MKKEQFVEIFKNSINDKDIHDVGVSVLIGDAIKPEIIVNTRENFESKLKYYEDSYDDDMCLRSRSDIKIINVEVNVLNSKISQVAKDLSISEVRGAKKNISDLVTYGDGDMFALLCKASSQNQGWMKSTKVCNLWNGCLVQVTTQQRNPDGSYAVAEALTFVPDVNLDKDSEPRRLKSTYE